MAGHIALDYALYGRMYSSALYTLWPDVYHSSIHFMAGCILPLFTLYGRMYTTLLYTLWPDVYHSSIHFMAGCIPPLNTLFDVYLHSLHVMVIYLHYTDIHVII